MNILLPNWNLSFKYRLYKSISGLKKYADKNNIILTEVKNISDIKKLLRINHISNIDIDKVFVGW